MAQKLTDKIVARLVAPDKGNRRTPDSEVKGFGAKVTKAGWLGFTLRYRHHGVEREITIGEFPTWTTVAARNRARELRRLIDQGIDPHEHEAQQRTEAITLADFWTRVYEPLHVTTRRPAWQSDIRSMMRRDILPRLGGVAIKDIDRADVEALHRRISQRAPVRANRALACLSHLLSYAERPHILESGERLPALRTPHSNPCRGVARNPEEPRERFLSPIEMARLAAVLDGHPERQSANAVRLLLLTGARRGEVLGATWDQFDFERGVWTKPSARTKQRKAHTIPLSAPVLQILLTMRADAGDRSRYLFSGTTPDKHQASLGNFWHSVMRQAGLEGVRVHDLRHSFASTLASSGASLLLIGQLLGHSQAQTTARYSHLVDDVQRAAVERAATVIAGGPIAEVVPLRQRR